MPLSRKTRKAQSVSKKRKIIKDKQKSASLTANEKIKFRLEVRRRHAAQARERESFQTKQLRLESLRTHALQVREIESPLERESRLQSIRIRVSQQRELESLSERESRLQSMRIHTSQAREIESPLERESRLQSIRIQVSQQRELESLSERESRLQSMRIHTSQAREFESPLERESRLQSIRIQVSQQRELESLSERESRLQSMRIHTSQAREIESPLERESRLQCIRIQVSQQRELESLSERESRLKSMRIHTSQAREIESPLERESRLQSIRIQVSHQRELESLSERESRLQSMRSHASQAREFESSSERELRLQSLRTLATQRRELELSSERETRLQSLRSYASQTYVAQRNLFQTDSYEFNRAISQIADEICYVCKQTKYKNQVKTTTFNSIMPAVAPDRFTACNRCHNALSSNKVPSTAYWNNMTAAEPPPKLTILSEMELRLIARIVPFIKIVKLGGRFGQKGFKGQAIIFAQQVEEVAEQLPLSTEQCGLTVVKETLQNVSSMKEYTVNLDNVHAALEWLVNHNHLYQGVTINLQNLQNAANHDHIVELPVRREPENINLEPESHFKIITADRKILRGKYNQGSLIFSESNRGKQCTANATAAIAYRASKAFKFWETSDIDRVLIFGDSFYSKCLSYLQDPPDYLATDELLTEIIVANDSFRLEFNVDCVVGLHNPTVDVLEGYSDSILQGIVDFFAENTAGILTAQTQISVAIMKEESKYFLFDSHSRGPKGFVAPSKGCAMLMIFNTIESLAEHLPVVIHARAQTNFQFSITAVKSTLISEASVNNTENSPHEAENTECSLELSTPSISAPIGVTALMANDYAIPDLGQVIINDGVANDETPLPMRNIHRQTAPPVSLLVEKRAEELAWVHLFPDGKNGLHEDRQYKITPLDYFQTRIMGSDKRFQNIEYLFYALSVVELMRVRQNVSVCGRLRQDGLQPTDLIQNIHLCMRNIRGTSSYWHRAFTELMAMVKNLGPPHFYITLSCDDLNWPDMLKALLVADGRSDFPVENLSYEEKLRLVESYPVTLSRQFMFRFNAVMRVMKAKSSPLLGRELVDFWWRVEFQLRGSPHVHMVVWCKDMPDFSSSAGIELLEQVVTCRLPQDSELRDLVTRLQTHTHSHTCYNNRSTNVCRFAFPKSSSDRTIILDDNQATSNGGKFYKLKRESTESMINNYNEILLKLWRANIDVQPVVSALGVAYYIAKYIAKSEPTNIQAAITEALCRVRERSGNFGQQVFAVQCCLLNHRQVSAAECAFRLCHLKLRDSSRKSVFANTCKPELRYRMLRFDTDTVEPCKNIFERYESRPRSLESLSLGEFAVNYEPLNSNFFREDDDGDADAYPSGEEETGQTITLLNRMGRMKKRTRPAVLRTRYYTADSDPEAYYYSMLVTHCPFRSENELMVGYEDAKSAFRNKRNQLRPLHDGYNNELLCRWETEIQDALRRLAAEQAADICNDAIDVQQPQEPTDFQQFDEIMVQEEEFDENVVGENMSEEEYLHGVHCLNVDQRQLFAKVSETLTARNDDTQNPLRLFITGGAGSGKSFTLKLIVEQIRRLSMDKQCVVITAPTGVAARLVGGCTLHSTFVLPIEKGRSVTLRPLSGDRLQRERTKWRKVKWIIIDEISMVPYTSLRNIHIRLQELKQNTTAFGGVNILAFGDLMQLPPVSNTAGGAYCFKLPDSLAAEVHLWRLFGFCS